MFDLEMLIISFAGGMFGAAIGGLPFLRTLWCNGNNWPGYLLGNWPGHILKCDCLGSIVWPAYPPSPVVLARPHTPRKKEYFQAAARILSLH